MTTQVELSHLRTEHAPVDRTLINVETGASVRRNHQTLSTDALVSSLNVVADAATADFRELDALVHV